MSKTMSKTALVLVTVNGATYLGHLEGNTLTFAMLMPMSVVSQSSLVDYITNEALGNLDTIELGAGNTHITKQIKAEDTLLLEHLYGMYRIAEKKAVPTIINQVFIKSLGK